jgi:hypothetical protein
VKLPLGFWAWGVSTHRRWASSFQVTQTFALPDHGLGPLLGGMELPNVKVKHLAQNLLFFKAVAQNIEPYVRAKRALCL